ncbi:biliverdin-producing heme oxygenase [Devosia sp.]|uniref:biliverdin-producing heme oxygenase n=1 Tax=Devosia sp. TaxID=1871048 RepID=UPI003A9237F5
MNETQRRWILRNRTAEAHAIVDAAVGAFDDLDSYKRYLLATYRFRIPLERRLENVDWPVGLGEWRPRRIGAQLQADLDDFGLPFPDLEQFDPPLEQSRIYGALYVLEGSSLGARVLLRRAETLGLSGDFGARHLAVLSAGDSWRGFLTQLEAVQPFDIDLATSASLDTFAVAAQAFQRD